MIEPDARNRDAQPAGIGKIRQAEATGFVLLPENHIAGRALDGAPAAHPPLQRAADAKLEIGMAAADLVEHGNGAHLRRGLQERHDLGVPDRRQRVGPPPVAWLLLLGWGSRVSLYPVAGGLGKTCLGSGHRHGVG